MRVPGFLRRLTLALLTGYIFVYFSEYSFYARPLDEARLPGAITLLIVYSFAAYTFLILIATFRIRSRAAIFLAGALFGWLIEGIFVQTMYEALPLSISFTGLAWHALITILFGWLGLQMLVRARRWWRTLRISALAGLAYGAWAIWWWTDSPPAIPVANFANFVLVTTALLALTYWLASRPALLHFTPTRIEIILTSILILLYLAFITIPTQPYAALILPPFVVVTLITLARNRRIETRPNILQALAAAGPIRLRDVLPLFAIPLVATAVYALATAANLLIPTGWAVYALTTPAGFILFAYSLLRIWRKRPATTATPAPTPPPAQLDVARTGVL